MISGNQWEFMENQSTNTIIGNGELSSILVYRTGGYLLVHSWNQMEDASNLPTR